MLTDFQFQSVLKPEKFVGEINPNIISEVAMPVKPSTDPPLRRASATDIKPRPRPEAKPRPPLTKEQSLPPPPPRTSNSVPFASNNNNNNQKFNNGNNSGDDLISWKGVSASNNIVVENMKAEIDKLYATVPTTQVKENSIKNFAALRRILYHGSFYKPVIGMLTCPFTLDFLTRASQLNNVIILQLKGTLQLSMNKY